MVKLNRSKSVPKNMQTTYEVMAGLTDAFCNQHLNAEYRDLPGIPCMGGRLNFSQPWPG